MPKTLSAGLKVSVISFNWFFMHLNESTIQPSCCKISDPLLFSIWDMGVFVRPYSNFASVREKLIYKLGN